MNPLPFRWTGEAMEPARGFAKRADEAFVVGQTYVLALQEDRSAKSHKHYFACIREAWKNLPEALTSRFPTEDHLRKRALIECGFYNEQEVVCASRAEAVRWATFVRRLDEYALTIAKENVVRVFTAKSQSERAMGKADFERSKEAVLEKLADIIGVGVADLEKAAA